MLLKQQASQNQQVEAGDREIHVLLKVGPALPGAASDSEDSLEPRDATFDAGPESSQLPVDPTGAHHLRDLQSAFLGKSDVLDPLLQGTTSEAAKALGVTQEERQLGVGQYYLRVSG